MTAAISLDIGSTWSLDVECQLVRAVSQGAEMSPLDDPAAAVAAALDDPLDFPPLKLALMPGDRVTVALDAEVPQAAAILAGVVHSVCESGTSPSNVQILLSSPADAAATSELPANLLDDIEVVVHDPANNAAMSYLAAARDGQAVYLNRVLCDADVVLPIGCLRLDDALGYSGAAAGLFPAFSNVETLARFKAPSSAAEPVHARRRKDEAAEAAWLLGSLFSVQVIPGPGGSILRVLAGEREAVSKAGEKLCSAAWRPEISGRADLVVATVDGDMRQQSWQSFSRALFAATAAVEEGGTIVICSRLASPPGTALRRLAAALDPQEESDSLVRELQRLKTADAIAAWLLASTLPRQSVYLFSDLEAETVEGLGMAPIQDPQEITRLSRQHDRCLLLPGAQFALPRVRE